MSMVAMKKFPQIEYHDATGDVKDTFDDMEATLRVPWVAFACRVMSTFPGFLPQAFRVAKPHHSTHHAEALQTRSASTRSCRVTACEIHAQD